MGHEFATIAPGNYVTFTFFIGLFGVQMVADPKAAQYSMDIMYNIGDTVNKIGFGLVIYMLSRKEE